MKNLLTPLVLIVFLMISAIPASAQDELMGQQKVRLHNGYYFIIPDSYSPGPLSLSVNPFLEKIASNPQNMCLNYSNKKKIINAVFTSCPSPKPENGLKNMGLEDIFKRIFNKVPNMELKLARTININGHETFFAKIDMLSKDKTGKEMPFISAIMYMVQEGNYLYTSVFAAPTDTFNSFFREFMEIQETFNREKGFKDIIPESEEEDGGIS